MSLDFCEENQLTKLTSFSQSQHIPELPPDYQLARLLTVSGQAKIYLATKDHHSFVLKVYPHSPKNLRAFRTQTSILKKLQFRGIIALEDWFQRITLSSSEKFSESGCHVIVMPFFRRGDLHSWVTSKGPLEEILARYFTLDLVKTLRYLFHKQILHKDIKAENIVLDERFLPVFIDFGLSSLKNQKTQSFAGTARYASPEVVKQKQYTTKSEVYSLGVLIFFLLSGKYPFGIAKITDTGYRLLFERKETQFWDYIQKKYLIKFSLNFKKLFVKLVQPRAEQRPSLDELLEWDWFKEDPLSNEDYVEKMSLLSK